MCFIVMKNILITGASGLLGSELIKSLYSTYNVLPTSRNGFLKKSKILDITQKDDVADLIAAFNPSIIINCAAYTAVDKAEVEKKNARDVNVGGLSNLIKACNKKTKIIHISSDYVFDGKSGGYTEDDPTFPINYYGKTKLESENLLIGSNIEFVILRPNVLYSNDLSKAHFLSWVVNSLSKGEEIRIATDQISNPTYIPDLLEVISDSIVLDFSGILHVGSEDSVSRYDFANQISCIFGLKNELIIPVESLLLKQKAKRPFNSSLNCNKIQVELNKELYPVEYGIRRVNLSA